MQSEKKICSQPKLYDYGGDLSKYWFIIYFDGAGNRKKVSKGINGHKTVRDRHLAASRIMDELRRMHKAKVFHKGRKIAMNYIERKKPTWRITTYRSYKTKVNVFFEWLGNRSISKRNVERFFEEHLMPLKGKTYNHYKVVLRQVLDYGLKLDTKFLFADIEKRKDTSQTAAYFTKPQATALSNWMQKNDPMLWLATQFVYYGFIRPRQELRFLRVGDVIFEEGIIRIHGDISKNQQTRRVEMPPSFAKILKKALKGRLPNEFIFHLEGTPYQVLGYNCLGTRHRKMLKKLHFDTKRYKMYGWKNTGMLRAIKGGMSLKWIQLQAGHHSLEETSRYLRKMGLTDVQEDLSKFPSM